MEREMNQETCPRDFQRGGWVVLRRENSGYHARKCLGWEGAAMGSAVGVGSRGGDTKTQKVKWDSRKSWGSIPAG